MYWRISAPPALYDEIVYTRSGYNYVTGADLNDNPEHVPFAKYLYGIAEAITGHQSLTTARVVAASCSILTAAVVALIVTRRSSAWAGHIAGLGYLLLPSAVSPQETYFGRSAMLEPVAGLFVALSLLAVLEMADRNPSAPGGRLWTVVAGVTVGLAVASKEFAGIPAAGALVACLVLKKQDRSCLAWRAATATAIGLLTFVATYLPLGGSPLTRISTLLRLQFTNTSSHHAVAFAGRVSDHPPWWTNIWYMVDSQGAFLTLGLVLLCVAALSGGPETGARPILGALLLIILAQCFAVHLMFSFYWELWRVPLLILAGLGLAPVAKFIGRAVPEPHGPVVARVLIVTVFVVVTIPAFICSVTARPVGPQAVANFRETHSLSGNIVASNVAAETLAPYFPTAAQLILGQQPTLGVRIDFAIPRDLSTVDTVLLSRPQCRAPRDPGVRALIQFNLGQGRLSQVFSDRLLTMYVAQRPLLQPPSSLIAAMPVETDSTGC